MKDIIGRGYGLLVEALPNALEENRREIKTSRIYSFDSKATVGHAWQKTGNQLGSSIEKFRVVYDGFAAKQK